MDIAIGSSEQPKDAEELRSRLFAFNEERTGCHDGQTLSCYLRDSNGGLIAGLDGFTWGGYGRIEFLWVEESHRGRGLGRRLMQAAIEEVRRRGASTIVLDTHTFQAPGFYAALGFVEVGRTTGTPRGHDEVLMQLALDA